MITLEKAEKIVKTGSCRDFMCSCDGECLVFRYYNGEPFGMCGIDTRNLPQSRRDTAQAYINANTFKEGDLVYVSDSSVDISKPLRVFLYMKDGRYVCAAYEHGIDSYKAGEPCGVTFWKFAMKTGERVEKIKEVQMKVGDKVEVTVAKGCVDVGKVGVAEALRVISTEFTYGQTVYDGEGCAHMFLMYTPTGDMIAGYDTDESRREFHVYKELFYAEDPTKEVIKEMTVAELEKALGHRVKIIK